MPARTHYAWYPHWPLMMRLAMAARYLDMPIADFDREVAAGRLPMPIMLGKHEHWSRQQLEEWVADLIGAPGDNWRLKCAAYADDPEAAIRNSRKR